MATARKAAAVGPMPAAQLLSLLAGALGSGSIRVVDLTQTLAPEFPQIALPPEMGQLTALKYLRLTGNELSALPPEIWQLTALEDLDLSGNQLSALPDAIGQL